MHQAGGQVADALEYMGVEREVSDLHSTPPYVISRGFTMVIVWEYGCPTQAVARLLGAPAPDGAGRSSKIPVGTESGSGVQ